MKKSTVLIISIIYFVSIVAIGFFGMAVKIYDEVKYVKLITIQVDAEESSMYQLEQKQDDLNGLKIYNLKVNFSNAQVGEFKHKGYLEERKFIHLNIIPHVTYDTGVIAGAKEESITYSLSDSGKNLVQDEQISFDGFGTLICFKKDVAFTVYVNPVSLSSSSVGAIVYVFVV